MGTDLTKRIVVRVSDEQLAWIGQMAADEGMDNATFVRVVIDRLSKGRAPLIGMMASRTVEIAPRADDAYYGVHPAVSELRAAREGGDSAAAGDVLAQRAAEAEAAIDEAPLQETDQDLGAAIPLRRVPRERFNPGRN